MKLVVIKNLTAEVAHWRVSKVMWKQLQISVSGMM